MCNKNPGLDWNVKITVRSLQARDNSEPYVIVSVTLTGDNCVNRRQLKESDVRSVTWQSTISAHYDTAHAQSSSSRSQCPGAKFECDVCGRKFTEKYSLKRHLSGVHGVGDVKTYQCDYCQYVSNHKHNVKLHMSKVHRLGSGLTFQCAICFKEFGDKTSLKEHISTVH